MNSFRKTVQHQSDNIALHVILQQSVLPCEFRKVQFLAHDKHFFVSITSYKQCQLNVYQKFGIVALRVIVKQPHLPCEFHRVQFLVHDTPFFISIKTLVFINNVRENSLPILNIVPHVILQSTTRLPCEFHRVHFLALEKTFSFFSIKTISY